MPLNDKIKAVLSTLTDEERELLLRLRELKNRDENAYQQALSEMVSMLYEFVPVPMEQFLTDPYYLGQFSGTIYPRLKRDLIELFDGNYSIIILTGSIGWGKTTFSAVSVLRIIYEILCFRNPPSVFGLMENATITVLLVGPTKNQVLYTLFDNVYNLVLTVPFFKEKVTKKIDLDEGIIDFPEKNLMVMAKSGDDNSMLGLNVIAAVIDEANFYEKTGARRVNTLYNVLTTRMKSRYLFHSRSPAKIFLVSSATTYDSFLETKVRELADKEGVFIRRYSLWDVKEGYYSTNTFPVFVGNRLAAPRIIREQDIDYYEKNYQNDFGVGPLVIKVPVDFYDDFRDDIYTALRDLAGYPVMSINPFLPNMEKFYNCVVSEQNPLLGGAILKHPFSHMVYEYPNADFYIDWDSITRKTAKGNRVPLINPQTPRFIHIDLGVKNDACGIAMGHIAEFERGKLFLSPVIYIDFMLRIKPVEGSEIYIEDIRDLILKFYDAGFNIIKITFDKFQSLESIQKFKSLGFNADTLSTESFEAYKLLKDIIYAGRIKFYYYEPFVKEIISLYLDVTKAKVDHPPEGSKDVADAVCGVVNSIYEYIVEKKVIFHSDDLYTATRDVIVKNRALIYADGIASSREDAIENYFRNMYGL